MGAPDARRRAVSRLRTAREVAVEEAAFSIVLKPGTYDALSHVDDRDVWHEALATWPSLGIDRAAACSLCGAHGWSDCGTLVGRTL